MSTSTALAGGPTVPDRLELEDAVLIGEGVELGVEAVEHVRQFGGAHLGADLCETHDLGVPKAHQPRDIPANVPSYCQRHKPNDFLQICFPTTVKA